MGNGINKENIIKVLMIIYAGLEITHQNTIIFQLYILWLVYSPWPAPYK